MVLLKKGDWLQLSHVSVTEKEEFYLFNFRFMKSFQILKAQLKVTIPLIFSWVEVSFNSSWWGFLYRWSSYKSVE